MRKWATAPCLPAQEKGWGIERLRSLVTGRQSVVAGQSGVGKSSLLNAVQEAWGCAGATGRRGQPQREAHDHDGRAIAASRWWLFGGYAGDSAARIVGRGC